ncbi:IS66 family insertion sequence element accessory protein TnpA [Alicyclobacillus dauci]|nr:helix-turn-helix domain-containing protein [Alicyclobacillus dauci]WAH35667.1 helix-turn-helix domain-containing protein [Alicyclobacillus dauci]WAH35966.1 helix-turn-helix domain-containing protein [Alicyclobacillus dauci]WAH37067.1 helix-turn-helix domain-containing protein [Alicyclobacillus dauci]WAH37534.1 helix-turn-helix domain-containing protein [Alicyclobacillus dauci]WAH37905.1 helix-turn-helix domain-containing protein [Alicyclobacillus dauci]
MTKKELAELRETWRERVAAFRDSGLSGAAWCAEQGIKEHQLWYWVSRFREKSPKPSVSTDFLPVQVHESIANLPLLVRVGSVAIEVHPGYDAQLLRDLVETLTGSC